MFLQESKRRKDGKEHAYWSLVGNRRVEGGRKVGQRHVLYLGEINSSQQEAWRKTIEIFENGLPRPPRWLYFPRSALRGGSNGPRAAGQSTRPSRSSPVVFYSTTKLKSSTVTSKSACNGFPRLEACLGACLVPSDESAFSCTTWASERSGKRACAPATHWCGWRASQRSDLR